MQLLRLSAILYICNADDCAVPLELPPPLTPIDKRACPRQVTISSPVDSKCCEFYVANRNNPDATISNKDCQKACLDDPKTFHTKKDTCIFQRFSRDGSGVETVQLEYDPDHYLCYSHWVYGYTEPSDLAGYRIIENVASPQLCQTMCQDDEECAHFMWTLPSGQGSAADDKRCVLKNKAQISGALAEDFTESQEVKDLKYCSERQGANCYNHNLCTPNLYSPRRTCVYESARHISGPKYCAVEPSSPEYSTQYHCYPVIPLSNPADELS